MVVLMAKAHNESIKFAQYMHWPGPRKKRSATYFGRRFDFLNNAANKTGPENYS